MMIFCVGLFLATFSSILETNVVLSLTDIKYYFDDNSKVVPIFGNNLNDASCNIMGIEGDMDKTCAFETELNLTTVDKCTGPKCVVNFHQNNCPNNCNQLQCRHNIQIIPNLQNSCTQDGIYYNLDERFDVIEPRSNCQRITKLDFDESGGCTARSKCFYNLLTSLPNPDGCTDESCNEYYNIYLGDANQCQNGNSYFHFGKYNCKLDDCDTGNCGYHLTVDLTDNEMCLEGKCLFNFGSTQCTDNLNNCFIRNKKLLDVTTGPNCYFRFGENMNLSDDNCENGNCVFEINIIFKPESCLNGNCFFNVANSNVCDDDGCVVENINYKINLNFGNECQYGSFQFLESLGLYVFNADYDQWVNECIFSLTNS